MPRLKLIHQDFNIFRFLLSGSNIFKHQSNHGGYKEDRCTWRPRRIAEVLHTDIFNTLYFNDNVNQMVEISLGFVPEYPLSNIIIGIRQCLCIFYTDKHCYVHQFKVQWLGHQWMMTAKLIFDAYEWVWLSSLLIIFFKPNLCQPKI